MLEMYFQMAAVNISELLDVEMYANDTIYFFKEKVGIKFTCRLSLWIKILVL